MEKVSRVFKIVGMIAGVAVAGLIIWAIANGFNNTGSGDTISFIKYDELLERAKEIDVSGYDFNRVIPASEVSGGYEENIEGDLSKAKVVIYEYADYQCTYCAYYNPVVNQILSDYGDDVAVVFRTYVLDYHDKGIQVASAAQAAGKQGYWQEYKDKLFDNQDGWYNSRASKLKQQLETYFVEASAGNGDLEQFKQDMADENIPQKLALDMAVGLAMKLEGTPAFYVNGEHISITDLHDKVGELLGK